jgi:hypothetical protein
VGVILLAAVLVIGATSSSRSATNQLTADQLRPGDCLVGSNLGLGNDTPWPDYVTSVPCTKQHIAEVFFAGDNWPQSLALPASGPMVNQADIRCDAELTAYDGIDYSQSAFTFDTITPSDSDWASGSRRLVCVAFMPYPNGVPGQMPVDYSIKGSAR